MRVATGLRAARLRANEALLRSLVDSIPGALYRCACDARLDDGVAERRDRGDHGLSRPATSSTARVRTFASVEHPDDHDYVAPVGHEVGRDRPALRPRVPARAADGSVRWVLERGQAQEAGDGRWWLDGAIFDVTARRAAEEALREHEVDRGAAGGGPRLARADPGGRRPRAPRHRAQPPRRRAAAPGLGRPEPAHLARRSTPTCPRSCRAPVTEALDELRAGLAELRDLARGLHPAVLSDHGLEHALRALAERAAVPGRARDGAARGSGCRWPLRRRPTSRSREALTNVAQVRRGEPRVRSRVAAARRTARRDRPGRRRRRCRRRAPARACRVCATASPPSTGRSRSRARRAAAPTLHARLPA